MLNARNGVIYYEYVFSKSLPKIGERFRLTVLFLLLLPHALGLGRIQFAGEIFVLVAEPTHGPAQAQKQGHHVAAHIHWKRKIQKNQG